MAAGDERRKNPRIKLPALTGIRVHVGKRAYELNNLADNGFGLFIDTPDHRFHLGQRFEQMQLEMDGQRHALTGAVAHITRTLDGHVVGVRLEIQNIDEYQLLAKLKQRCQEAVEADGDAPAP